MECSICKEQITGYGHNAEPINDDRCCNKCNDEVACIVGQIDKETIYTAIQQGI